ncbi:hypothetical protein Mapa_013730 [Marchantia paleacea]|nr:hypothetical protein Mapa_013730 [Marchantia paleacea]
MECLQYKARISSSFVFRNIYDICVPAFVPQYSKYSGFAAEGRRRWSVSANPLRAPAEQKTIQLSAITLDARRLDDDSDLLSRIYFPGDLPFLRNTFSVQIQLRYWISKSSSRLFLVSLSYGRYDRDSSQAGFGGSEAGFI